MQTILLAAALCLFPLAGYLFWLAALNHRRPPALVRGPWDFAAALLGLAGIIIVAVPAGLSGFEASGRLFWVHRAVLPAADDPPAFAVWRWLWAGYALAVLLGGSALVAARRRLTVVYNVAGPDPVRQLLTHVLAEQGPVTAAGPVLTAGGLKVIVSGSEGLRSATLDWRRADAEARLVAEDRLREELARNPDYSENPVTGWLLTFAGCAAVSGFACVGLLIYLLFRS